MKKNTKGFTLIELLAVIVILAIIALIAVPVIMNILNKSRQSAAADSAYSILNAAELYYAEALLEHPTEAFQVTTITFANKVATVTPNDTELHYEVKGTMPETGSVTIDKNGKASITAGSSLLINGLTCTQNADETISCE